jgi:hypothetical protein
MKNFLFYAVLACSAAFAPMGVAAADEATVLVKKGIAD